MNDYKPKLHRPSVYLAYCARWDILKVGYTANITNRLKSLERDMHASVTLIDIFSSTRKHARHCEKEIHRKFSLKGEWHPNSFEVKREFQRFKLEAHR